jgi:hypothetical protein
VTLYKEQWLKLLDMSDDIRAFIATNDAQLKTKIEDQLPPTAALPPDQHSPIVFAWLRDGMRYRFAPWQHHVRGMRWWSPPLGHCTCFGGTTHRDILGARTLLCALMKTSMIHFIAMSHIVRMLLRQPLHQLTVWLSFCISRRSYRQHRGTKNPSCVHLYSLQCSGGRPPETSRASRGKRRSKRSELRDMY